MRPRIDFLMPLRSSYRILQHFTEKICAAFSRQGFDCRLVPPENHFTTTITHLPDYTFAINGLPFNSERQMLCDIIQRPHLSWMVDPPFRFLETFSSPYLIPLCDDRAGCRFLKEQGLGAQHFFPHAVERELIQPPNNERSYDIVMLASYIDYSALRAEWIQGLPKKLCDIMDASIEKTFSDHSTSFMFAFLELYEQGKNEGSLPNYSGADISALLTLLEMYIKGCERTRLLKSIKKAKVLVLGDHDKNNRGWETELGDNYPNITVRPGVNYEEGLALMRQAKIILNPSLKNKEGGHERIFNGTACGALVLTGENIWLKESFTDRQDILFYNPWELDVVEDKLTAYLSDEAARRQIVARGQEIILSGHTWDSRIASLLNDPIREFSQ